MKKMLSALLASLMLLSLAGCGGSSSAPAQSSPAPAQSAAASGDVSSDPKVTLVYAEVNPADTIVGQTAAHFKERVEELSGGSITIDVQYSGVLGSENDVLDAMLGGSTSNDMSRISAFALNSYGAQKSMLSEKIEDMTRQLLAGPGTVRATLERYLKN